MGFFNSVTGNISDKYELDTTPAGWTFSIWGIIYLAIASTLAFYVFTILKRNDEGYIYVINFLMNLGWIFLWDRELLVVSSYFLCGIAITNIIAMTLFIRNIVEAGNFLKLEQRKFIGLTLFWR